MATEIKLLDLERQYKILKSRIKVNTERVYKHGQFIMGPEIVKLEERLAKYCGVKHAVACSSGTDALLLALMAKGIGPGDAILTTPFTFVATGEVIARVGARPVFADIDKHTKNISPEDLEKRIAAVKKEGKWKLRGIITVDLFGLLADYDAIEKIAQKHQLFIIEDAAQSFGSSAKGRKAGNIGELAAASFFPAKPLGCYGDGGAVFTHDSGLAEKVRSMRAHGYGSHKYDHVRLGMNGRMDTLQAAILLAKLEIFNSEIKRRQAIAKCYHQAFQNLCQAPVMPKDGTCVWAQYSLEMDNRDAFIVAMQQKKIPTVVYYPIPLHLQVVFQYLGYQKGDLPVAESAANRIVSLPIHPYLKDAEVEYIIKSTINFFSSSQS